MILVTLGTQKQKMYRLLEAIENSNIEDEILVQAGGSSDFVTSKMKIFEYISYEDMQLYLDKASLVITHGGTGSIMSALKKGKKIIACPRLSKYKEHVDDHQKDIVDNFSEIGYLVKFDDGDNFFDKYIEAQNFKPKTYKSNKANFIKKLVERV